MTWPTAIAAVMRFYKGAITWPDIWNMTIDQFTGMLEQIGNVVELEIGEEPKKEVSLSGEKAFALGRQILPRGRGWKK